MVRFLVESKNGHDEFEVAPEGVKDEVINQLRDDKWVTLERNDGSTQILTTVGEAQRQEDLGGFAGKTEEAKPSEKKEEAEEPKAPVQEDLGSFGANADKRTNSQDNPKGLNTVTATKKMKGG